MAKKKAKSRYQKRANRKPEPRLPGNKKPGHRKPVSPGPAPVENTDPATGETNPTVSAVISTPRPADFVFIDDYEPAK